MTSQRRSKGVWRFLNWFSKTKSSEPSPESSSPTEHAPLQQGRLSKLRRLATDLMMLLLLGVLLVLLVIELQREVVVLEPFEVPEVLAERGYTGRAVARKLIDQLNEIYAIGVSSSYNTTSPVSFSPAWEQESSEIEMQGTMISVRSFAQYLNDLLHRNKVRVSGELTLEEDHAGIQTTAPLEARQIRVSVRVNQHPANEHREPLRSQGFPTTLDCLLRQAARDVFMDTSPYTMVLYHYRREEKEQCRAAIEACLKKPNVDDVHALLMWGNLKARDGDLVQATDKYRRAAVAADRLDLQEPLVYVAWADTLRRMGKIDEAKAKLIKAERLDDDLAGVHLVWGDLLFDQGKDLLAVERFERAVSVEPDNPQARFYLARALRQQNRTHEARQHLDRALELNPDYAPSLVELKELVADPTEKREIANRLIAIANRKKDLEESRRCEEQPKGSKSMQQTELPETTTAPEVEG